MFTPYRKVDIDLARKVGLPAAVVYDFIRDACRYNKSQNNKRMFKDGFWWCSASYVHLVEMCAISKMTARRAISVLETLGYIEIADILGDVNMYRDTIQEIVKLSEDDHRGGVLKMGMGGAHIDLTLINKDYEPSMNLRTKPSARTRKIEIKDKDYDKIKRDLQNQAKQLGVK